MAKSITLAQLMSTNVYNNTLLIYNGTTIYGSRLKESLFTWQKELTPTTFATLVKHKAFMTDKEQIKRWGHLCQK